MTSRLAGSHERLSQRQKLQPGSNRSFGMVFAAVFAIVALVPLVLGDGIAIWALLCSVAFLGVALLRPSLLAPANSIWFRFGLLLHHIVNPVVLGVMYFGIITPLGVAIRLFGGKLLSLRADKSAPSYWLRRVPAGPDPESVRNQF